MPVNASSYPAPSAATIAAAVAAPSAATIASTVAAAVPTISAINSSVASNAPSPNAWTLVASVSPAYSAASFTFSSLSGYKTYKIVIPYLNISGVGSSMGIRLNGDTASNYSNCGERYLSSTPQNVEPINDSGSVYYFGSVYGPSSGSFQGTIFINNCNLAGSKDFQSNCAVYGNGDGTIFVRSTGVWLGTATVTSITVQNFSGGLIGNGKTVYLYGAN